MQEQPEHDREENEDDERDRQLVADVATADLRVAAREG
jgi:hypothetical protein